MTNAILDLTRSWTFRVPKPSRSSSTDELCHPIMRLQAFS
jgi:hypothetical protein